MLGGDRARNEKPTDQVTRRSSLSQIGAAGVAAGAAPLVAGTQSQAPPADMPLATGDRVENAVSVTLSVNGKSFQIVVDLRTTLLDGLRETISFTGTRKGCDHGQCGGVGEIGLAGIASAITNAIHRVTGVRVREFPVRTEDLLEAPTQTRA